MKDGKNKQIQQKERQNKYIEEKNERINLKG